MATINGTGRADTLHGAAGPDTIDGLQGDDRLFGLGGDDLLIGGPGTNRIDGGARDNVIQDFDEGIGADTFRFSGRFGHDVAFTSVEGRAVFAGLTRSDVGLGRAVGGDDLTVSVEGRGDSVRFVDLFNPSRDIDLVFRDGTLMAADIA